MPLGGGVGQLRGAGWQPGGKVGQGGDIGQVVGEDGQLADKIGQSTGKVEQSGDGVYHTIVYAMV
jgi:hypothetical protein